MGSAADAVRESHQTSGRMRSTWFLAPRTQWSWAMALLNDMQPHTTPAPPEHFGRLPAMSSAAALATFVPRVLAFVALQHAVHRAWRPLPLPAAVLYWSVAYQVCVGHAATLLLRMGAKWGFFDGARPRDKVPDLMTTKIAAGILWSCVVRIALGALFLYDAAAPVRVSLAAPLHLFVFAMALDLCFYTYHRSCHEVDSLWAIHKTHHLTKHPSPALGLLADPGQEFLEVILCPTLATLATKRLFPASFGFYEWALCIICINIMEVLGHSGVRAHLPAFATGWVFGVLLPRAVLTIEQHDLHHREGWRRSTNYGKQSLFWDWLFGTLGERREGRDDNVDWSLGLWDAVPAGHTTPPSA